MLETLVVLAIIGLTTSIILQAVKPLRTRAIATRTTVDIRSLLTSARDAALKSGTPRHVDFIKSSRQFVVREGGQRKIIGTDVDLDLVTAAEAVSEPPADGEVASFLFLPDGTGSGGTVTIRVGASVRIVRISWLTGALTDG